MAGRTDRQFSVGSGRRPAARNDVDCCAEGWL